MRAGIIAVKKVWILFDQDVYYNGTKSLGLVVSPHLTDNGIKDRPK